MRPAKIMVNLEIVFFSNYFQLTHVSVIDFHLKPLNLRGRVALHAEVDEAVGPLRGGMLVAGAHQLRLLGALGLQRRTHGLIPILVIRVRKGGVSAFKGD